MSETTNETPVTEVVEATAHAENQASAEPEVIKENTGPTVAEVQAELSKVREQLLRTAADFDNYRKRARRDVDDAEKKGANTLLSAMLPVFDNLERAVHSAEQATDAKAIAEGVKMVLKQFLDSLERVNIKRVAALGSAFNPMVHEAIQQVETKDAPPGTVIAEIAPGYQHGDRLVRAAMVVVAKAPSETPAEKSN